MIIVVANHKGGVGKTAIASHLLFRAAERGLRAVGVDLDAQANLTATFVSRDATLGKPGADKLFVDGDAAAPMATDTPGVYLLPANEALLSIDKAMVSTLFEGRARIQGLVGSQVDGAPVDIVVVDTAPAIGLRLSAAAAAASLLVVPLMPELYSVQGVASLLDELNAIRSNLNHGLGDPIYAWNLVNPTANQHKTVMADMGQAFPDILGPLHRHIAVADALADRRPVWRKATNQNAAKEWRELMDAVLDRAGAPNRAPVREARA